MVSNVSATTTARSGSSLPSVSDFAFDRWFPELVFDDFGGMMVHAIQYVTGTECLIQGLLLGRAQHSLVNIWDLVGLIFGD